MPAVTAPNILDLPVVRTTADQMERSRPVLQIATAAKAFEGEGCPVRRPFAGLDRSLADPFLLLDQMGEVQYAPGEAKGAPDHPHRGFETVTYMIDGEFVHRDSTGGGGIFANGATQWMTAGAEIVHSEMPPEHLIRSGGPFHGVQLWVNLPAAKKWSPPGYQDIAASSVTLLRTEDGGALVRVIAGEAGGESGPGVTRTPIAYAHATLAAGGRLDLPWRPDFNALVYALSGHGEVGLQGASLESGRSPSLGRARASASRARHGRTAAHPHSTCSSLVGGRSASRSCSTGRSS